MSTTQKSPGKIIELTAPGGGVVTGLGYIIGKLFVVAVTTAAATVKFSAATEGEFTLPKTSAQAWAEGDRIYWDAGNARADNVPTVGQLIGVATAVADNPSSSGSVKLLGNVPDLNEGLQAAIADLTAITGGEAPTEAEHNLVVTKVNAILAALRIHGLITP
jgi:predicted RecA/RadA family phage recombinase